MGFRKKAGGYVIIQWDSDHPPMHVHVYRDRVCVARFNLEDEEFMEVDLKHRGRIIKALKKAGLLKDKSEKDKGE